MQPVSLPSRSEETVRGERGRMASAVEGDDRGLSRLERAMT
jgi:hypothetical protein